MGIREGTRSIHQPMLPLIRRAIACRRSQLVHLVPLRSPAFRLFSTIPSAEPKSSSDDGDDATHQQKEQPRSWPAGVAVTAGKVKGEVKFCGTRYAWVATEDVADNVCVPLSQILLEGDRVGLQIGEDVEFQLVIGKSGKPVGLNVTGPLGAPVQGIEPASKAGQALLSKSSKGMEQRTVKLQGTVRDFDRSFGWIIPDPIFVHHTDTNQHVQVGDKVRFEVKLDDQGRRSAKNVTIASDRFRRRGSEDDAIDA